MEKPDVNSFQVGGNHYGLSKVQHWDYVELNGLGYLEGCATKYAIRNRKKHESPLEDWRKAQHYTLKLLDLYREGLRLNRRLELNAQGVPLYMPLQKFATMHNLTPDEVSFLGIMTFWSNEQDLLEAVEITDRVLKTLSDGDL